MAWGYLQNNPAPSAQPKTQPAPKSSGWGYLSSSNTATATKSTATPTTKSTTFTGPLMKGETRTVAPLQNPAWGAPSKLPNGNTGYTTNSGSKIEITPDGNRKVTLAPQFGGGAYNINSKDTNAVINTGHTTYGGEKGQSGKQRDDIVPVGLGGDNSSSSNIRFEKLVKGSETSTDPIEKKAINDYKSGKITLAQARLAVMTTKQNQTSPQPSTSVAKNFLPSLGQSIKTAGNTALDLPKSLYKPFTSPSPTEQQIEKTFPKSPVKPLAQGFSRFFEPMIEPFGQQVGTAIGSGGKDLPSGLDAFMAGANTGMTVAGSLGLGEGARGKFNAEPNLSEPSPVLKTNLEPTTETPVAQLNKPTMPEIIKPKDSGLVLRSGFDPGVDKFVSEDVKPVIEKTKAVASTVAGAVKDTTNYLGNVLDAGKAVEKGFGGKAYSDVIRAIHTPEAENLTFDNNFKQAEQWFNQFSPKDLEQFNLTRGTPQSPEGASLQTQAQANLPKALQDPTLVNTIKQASDHVFNLAKDAGLDMNYFEDYFRGVYKDPAKVQNFMDYWRSTDAFTKEKQFPTVADAQAFGLQLKDPNPITNIKSELQVVAQRIGLKSLVDKLNADPTSSNFIKPTSELTPEQVGNWKAIKDPTFSGMSADPKYADFVNNLLSTNKVSQNPFTKAMRQVTFIAQKIKFFGSLFHMQNELKASIAQEAGGVFDPRGYKDAITSFKPIDKTDPLYKDYTNLGGGHKYSLEAQALERRGYVNALDKFQRGNYIGGSTRVVAEALKTPSKFTSWMFDSYIPKLKFEKFTQEAETQSNKLGRPLTDAEKIKIIKQNQNMYGEMNERLFGRSGTATSAARLLFSAPGYAEGNFRLLGSAFTGNLKAGRFIVNSLMTSAVAAAVGTKIMTGKWPDMPKKLTDVRDLFKIKTNLTDGNGDTVYYDLMTYDKDYWSILGNLATGQPSKVATDLTSRVAGMFGTPAKVLTDLSAVVEGKNVVDYKGDPIYLRTDPFAVKLQKFIAYEGNDAQPISTSTFGQSKTRGVSLGKSAVSAATGIRPTTSEEVKTIKSARSDLFSMQDEKKNKQVELNKLANENQDEAIKQAKAFNAKQMAILNRIFKNQPVEMTQTDLDKYLLVNLNPPEAKKGTTYQSLVGQ